MGERILENEKETIHESGLIHFKRKENSYHLVRIRNLMFGPRAMQSIRRKLSYHLNIFDTIIYCIINL